jgi:6-phosphogluconolactonase
MSDRSTPPGSSQTLYVGTHRRAHRDDPVDIAFGLYVFRRLGPHGRWEPLDMVETPQPGWIAVHPSGRFLYAVNEVSVYEGANGGGVTAFEVEPGTGRLRRLNSRQTLPLPCHCAIDATGRFLLAATYGGGSVHLFPVAPDGSLGPESDCHGHQGSSVHPRRQTQPHPHAVVLDHRNRFVLVPDLGTDQIRVYEFQADRARLKPVPERTLSLPPGSGPRHLVFGVTGRFAYLINEMSATIMTLSYDPATGGLHILQTTDLLPTGFAGLRSGAAIVVHPNGRTLYATTRSHGSSGEPPVRGLDQLLWFDINPTEGTLQPCGRIPGGGEVPRSFALDSHGETLLVGHQCSGTVVEFRIEAETGDPIADQAFDTPVPVCLCLRSS